MKCCGVCIGDRHLLTRYIPDLSDEVGTCAFCGTRDQPLVDPIQLRDPFELVTGIYIPNDSGSTLADWLKRDWAMFTHPRMDKAHTKELLAEILDDGEATRRKYVPTNDYHSDALDRWDRLRIELMHENRFFPTSGIDLDELEGLLPNLLLGPSDDSTTWYRARILRDDQKFSVTEMGAPPKREASHGRANPAGIPYLYLASTSSTAIAEVRPHPGDRVAVAEFEVSGDLSVIDLAMPRETVSPFVLADEGRVGVLRAAIGFLERLGTELGQPILPRSAAIDYIPTQYLCEFVKNCGYHGIRYKSAVGPEMNLALFSPGAAYAREVSTRRVLKIAVEHTESAGS